MNSSRTDSLSSLKQPSGWEVPDRPLNDLLAVWLAGLVLFLAAGSPVVAATPSVKDASDPSGDSVLRQREVTTYASTGTDAHTD